MIPYDDLVAALSAWRARQGLPVSTMGGGGSGAAAAPGSGPHAQSGSGPYAQSGSGPTAKPGSGPTRSAPPAPPSGRHNAAMPPPLALGDDMQEVDETALLEEQYENEGQDFAMGFGNQASDDSETAIGNAPERATDPSDFQGGGRGGRGGRDDW